MKIHQGLHRTHPGFALCLCGLICFWGFLSLGYLFSPDSNIVKVGTLEYVNSIPRHVWSLSTLLVTIGMISGAAQVPNKTTLLRLSLSFGCLLAVSRGILTTFPYVEELFSPPPEGRSSSFGGLATYLLVLAVQFAALMEPVRNPLTEKRVDD